VTTPDPDGSNQLSQPNPTVTVANLPEPEPRPHAHPHPLAHPGPGKAARPPALSASPDVGALTRALRRRWALALPLAVLASAALTTLAWVGLPHLMPATHLVRTTLHVSSKRPALLPGTSGDGRLDFSTYQRTQTALITSRLVLSAALADPRVAELSIVRGLANPVEWLEKKIKADYTIAPEILSISIAGENASELVVLVNAVRDAYLQEIVNREQNELNTRLDRLKQFYAAKEEVLRRKRATLRGLAQSVGSQDAQTLARAHQYLLERLSMVQKELIQVRSDLRKAQVEALAEQAKEKAASDQVIPEGAVEEQIRKDQAFEQQRLEIARLEQEHEKARNLAVRPDHPAVAKAGAALMIAKKVHDERREKLRPLIVAQLRERARYEAQANAAHRRERVSFLDRLQKELEKEVKSLEGETGQIKKGTVEIESLREEVVQEEDAVKKIGAQVQALTFELQAPARVTLLESATSSPKPDRREVLAGSVGVLTFTFVLLGVALWEFRTRRVNGAQEVVQGLGIRLVGAIPALPRRARGRLTKASGSRELRWRNLLTESIDMTRTMLVRAARKDSLQTQVVMVTSALAGEGKTSLSSHLAISLARAGFNTLLIDGDLRRPAAHRLFEAEVKPGFNEVLRGEVDVAATIRPTHVRGLSLIPAGEWSAHSTSALAQEGVAALLARLRRDYAFIVVDSSPVLPVVDPLLLGQHADGVLFSILHDVSRLPSVYAAYERVASLGIRILGAVISGTREGIYDPRYQRATGGEI
jgi:capsular exopolysaccharide synthesis family protein